jgi:hypothetical protein
MTRGREGAAALVLPDGRVLVAGGSPGGVPSSDSVALSSAELYEPANGVWTDADGMNVGRWLPTLTMLRNGDVLAIGGPFVSLGTSDEQDIELFDADDGTWTFDGRLPIDPNVSHTATLLDDGSVLVVGGARWFDDFGAYRYIPLDMR